MPCRPLQRVPSFLGSCVAGYVGERCQFSDLEWWEQQRAGRAKVRNITITVCAAALALLLLLGVLAAYCHRYRFQTGLVVCAARAELLLLLSHSARGWQRELLLS